MAGYNKVQLLGNLGADPELHNTGQTSVLKLRLATTESYFDKRTNERKEQTDWHSVMVFGARADALANLLQKGSQIFVEGKLKTSMYEKNGEKRYKTEVLANDIKMLGSNPRKAGPPQNQPPAQQRRVTNPDRHPTQFAEDPFNQGRQNGGAQRMAPEHRGYAHPNNEFGEPMISDDDIPF